MQRFDGGNEALAVELAPVSPERLKVSVQNLLKVNALTEEVKRLNKKVGGSLRFSDLIASSPAMANVLRLGRRGAQSNIPMLIEGESGVGKEMIARAVADVNRIIDSGKSVCSRIGNAMFSKTLLSVNNAPN